MTPLPSQSYLDVPVALFFLTSSALASYLLATGADSATVIFGALNAIAALLTGVASVGNYLDRRRKRKNDATTTGMAAQVAPLDGAGGGDP